MKHILTKTVTWEDAEYNELNIDLDGLTGDELLDAEREFILEGGKARVPEFSKGYLACVAAKAAKVPIEVIRKLPGKDFTAITLSVQDFLLSYSLE